MLACVILMYGIYLMFNGRSSDKEFLIVLSLGFLVTSVALTLDTHSWSSYSRERRQQKRFQLGLNYFSVVSMAGTFIYLTFFF